MDDTDNALVMLARKMDLLRIALAPAPSIAHDDLYAFARLPGAAWIAVIRGPDGTLVCHDAHKLARAQDLPFPTPSPVVALANTPPPCHDAAHVDVAALAAFFVRYREDEIAAEVAD